MNTTERSLDFYIGNCFANLHNNEFEFPSELLEVYDKRGNGDFVSYQCFFYLTKYGKIVEMFDPQAIVPIIDKHNYAGQLIVRNQDITVLPKNIIKELSLTDGVILEGDHHLINLWNPRDFAKYEADNESNFERVISTFLPKR
jgi:hypothetical protein